MRLPRMRAHDAAIQLPLTKGFFMPMTMEERIDHARAALDTYFSAKGESPRTCDADYEDTDVSDLIADLLHLQTYFGVRDIDKTMKTALLHFRAEEEAEGKNIPAAPPFIEITIKKDGVMEVQGLPEGWLCGVKILD